MDVDEDFEEDECNLVTRIRAAEQAKIERVKAKAQRKREKILVQIKPTLEHDPAQETLIIHADLQQQNQTAEAGVVSMETSTATDGDDITVPDRPTAYPPQQRVDSWERREIERIHVWANKKLVRHRTKMEKKKAKRDKKGCCGSCCECGCCKRDPTYEEAEVYTECCCLWCLIGCAEVMADCTI